LFFLSVWLVPRSGVAGIARYDLLLLIALVIQLGMLAAGKETWDELKAICVFHVLGFALEVFKTSSGIKSWSYPDPAFTKLWGVPLFSGFMYAAVGSYIIQAWRLLHMRVEHHPPYWMSGLVACAIYLNFFTHHYVGDYRWYLGALALGLYARSRIVFGRKHWHLLWPVGIPPPDGCLGGGACDQMERLVFVGAHELHHRHAPQTHQSHHPSATLKPRHAWA
jgi:uncharacterized membrane protein YoaT (DUF817 family)